MKIYVLGSNSFVNEMVDFKNKLIDLGLDGWIHPDYEAYTRGEKLNHMEMWENGEAAKLKRDNGYLKAHYQHICQSDAIFIVNLNKKGIEDYIGGNVLIEMGQAYVNNKKIFLLGNIPRDVAYVDEIESMDPICLKGDIKKILNYI